MDSRDERRVIIDVAIDRRINFAMQQNDVPAIKALQIRNLSPEPLRDLHLRVAPQPEFADPWETRIECVGPDSTYELPKIDLALSPTYLRDVTERVRGQLRFELFQDGQRIAEQVEPVEILARDEWSGLSSLPEILAAFVMPNHPAAESVLVDAAKVLDKWSRNPSLSGYQSKDPQRVFVMAGAIYTAIQNLGLTYINPPASFEMEGQRIRLPDRILESRMGTCLDLAVLAAGCLEQAGLHPLLVLIEGHAFAGTWLQEECFPEPSTDEPLRLRKRVDLGEIAVFDPTRVTERPMVSFEDSVGAAKRHLDDPQRFRCVIDVRRARVGRIRPMPERIDRTLATPAEHDDLAPRETAAPNASLLPPPAPDHATSSKPPETPATRLDRWRRKLLDLSLRNRLLNFRETKKTIPLLCADSHTLEDALADGEVFRVLPRFADLGDRDPRSAAMFQRNTADDAVAALLREELSARRLRADLTPEELDRRLLEVYRAARLALEEGGASTLYLAVGFLAWHETPTSTQQRLAPILLLPLHLHRPSVREGFTLQRGDDEPLINVTLLELLKQDFGITVAGLDPLPKDDSGVDVQLILRIFREAIRDVDRWDVVDSVRIGTFSFAKFLMWRDLEKHADALMTSSVVDHLVNRPDQEFDPGGSFPEPDRLDETHSALQTFSPLAADGSQLAAVHAAAAGRSFVLQGPPGTGKSQTITNLIAHCVANDKTVLFVAEKMAALNVVYDRLQKVGLGHACLELHSNKADKKKVLPSLDDALRQQTAKSPEEWEHEARRVDSLRTELNAYVGALHQARAIGQTVFQVTSRLVGLREVPLVPLRWPSAAQFDRDRLETLRDLVERLTTAAAAVGDASTHPWRAVRCKEWTPAWEQEVTATLAELSDAARELGTRAKTLAPRLAFAADGWSFSDLAAMDQATETLLGAPPVPNRLLVEPNWEETRQRVESWIDHGRRRDTLRAEIDERFTPEALTVDLEVLDGVLQRATKAIWPLSWWRRRKLLKSLNAVTREGHKLPFEQVKAALQALRSLREEEQFVNDAGEPAKRLLGDHWKGGAADWELLGRGCEWVTRFRDLAARTARGDDERERRLRDSWAQLVSGGALAVDQESTQRMLAGYRAAYATLCEGRSALDSLLDADSETVWGEPTAAEALERMERRLDEWRGKTSELRNWCAWQRARSEAVDANLTPLIERFERSEFPATNLVRVFDRAFYQWWHTAIVSSEPVLARFFSPEHQRKIGQFCDADDRYMALTRDVIASRLANRRPAASTVDLPNSEVGILKRAILKPTRVKLRKLMGSIPNLLPRLKPCFLMSPLSVAQYLDTSFKFDLVVFDEASQVPAWDAVGALGRADQAVIVGDPKQLPPTSFFSRSEDEESEEADNDVVEDLESILDDCMSARLPELLLNWHYRSRHETLIAFSNYHYYDNRLLTFPSPHREGMGVSLRPVPEGVYDRGKSATNRGEAQAVVDEVVRRLKDPELRRYSIGVVTFSQAQQKLVEDLLEQVRIADPEVDTFFAEEAREPVFVKNLENVQGDERDVILFSICYGPDATGRVAMNFGPMNREGGERRLNVAITRARREVLVFSTLRADQIDLARSRARGVRDLKAFLEYAGHGPSAITAESRFDPDAIAESPFEQDVYDALKAQGWEAHHQVGCARYRIDLGVVDPRAPGRYLLGVECDGANYHRAKTARDRDKLREAVLRDLGWKVYRIWSTDWWTNPEEEIQKLVRALEAAMSAGVEAAPAVVAPMPARPAFAAGGAVAPRAQQAELPLTANLPVYRPFRPSRAPGKQEMFYEFTSQRSIREVLTEVVNAEGPISLSLAARRVAAHWGFGRVTQKTVKHIETLLPGDEIKVNTTLDGTFLWPKAMSPMDYDGFRVPAVNDPDSHRSIEDLPVEEIAYAALHILRPHISAPVDDIVRETSRLFGFQRLGSAVENRVRAGLKYLVGTGLADEAEGRLTVRDGRA